LTWWKINREWRHRRAELGREFHCAAAETGPALNQPFRATGLVYVSVMNRMASPIITPSSGCRRINFVIKLHEPYRAGFGFRMRRINLPFTWEWSK